MVEAENRGNVKISFHSTELVCSKFYSFSNLRRMKNDDGTRPKLLTEHRKESVPASQVSLIQITLDSASGRRCDKLGTRNRTTLSFLASAISLRLTFQIVFIFYAIFLPFCGPKNFRKCHKSSFDSICLSHLK